MHCDRKAGFCNVLVCTSPASGFTFAHPSSASRTRMRERRPSLCPAQVIGLRSKSGSPPRVRETLYEVRALLRWCPKKFGKITKPKISSMQGRRIDEIMYSGTIRRGRHNKQFARVWPRTPQNAPKQPNQNWANALSSVGDRRNSYN